MERKLLMARNISTIMSPSPTNSGAYVVSWQLDIIWLAKHTGWHRKSVWYHFSLWMRRLWRTGFNIWIHNSIAQQFLILFLGEAVTAVDYVATVLHPTTQSRNSHTLTTVQKRLTLMLSLSSLSTGMTFIFTVKSLKRKWMLVIHIIFFYLFFLMFQINLTEDEKTCC